MIETVKYDAGVTGDYMRLMEDEEVLLERGFNQGKIAGLQQSIIDLLGQTGTVTEELANRICEEQDLAVLKIWLQYAAKATSIQEFETMIE